jgi:hypothetical protein
VGIGKAPKGHFFWVYLIRIVQLFVDSGFLCYYDYGLTQIEVEKPQRFFYSVSVFGDKWSSIFVFLGVGVSLKELVILISIPKLYF